VEYIEVTANFKIIIESNIENIKLDNNDDGFKRRIKYIYFPITFVDEPKKEN
jgi:phage/plasmid-associated DNA primase